MLKKKIFKDLLVVGFFSFIIGRKPAKNQLDLQT